MKNPDQKTNQQRNVVFFSSSHRMIRGPSGVPCRGQKVRSLLQFLAVQLPTWSGEARGALDFAV